MPPIPTPSDGESKDDFMHRCMGSKAIQEFESQDQRVAVCMRQWRDHHRSASDAGESRMVPGNPNDRTCAMDEAWSAPTLADFTDQPWSALSVTERRRIAQHFAWSDEMPPTSFGSLKFPHHRPSDGAVNFRGVAAAAARLNQAQGVDRTAIAAHLRAHYAQFDQEPPDAIAARSEGPIGEERGFTVAPALELREEGIRPRLFGYAVVFNSPSRGLPWTEVVRPGAFRAALASSDDIVALFNHDPSQILGRRSARTLDLAEDERGLKFEVQPPETQPGRDVITNVRAGNITGMSFTFQARKQRWDFTVEPNARELLEVGLTDISPVTFPAYPRTDVSVRARDAAREAWEAQRVRFQVIDADRARRLRLAEAGR